MENWNLLSKLDEEVTKLYQCRKNNNLEILKQVQELCHI
jgi:hypothetical protein